MTLQSKGFAILMATAVVFGSPLVVAAQPAAALGELQFGQGGEALQRKDYRPQSASSGHWLSREMPKRSSVSASCTTTVRAWRRTTQRLPVGTARPLT